MWHQADYVRVLFKLVRGFYLIVGRTRGNDKPRIERGLGGDDSLDWPFCEDQPNSRPILRLFAVGGVVHLKDQLRAGLDKLRFAGFGDERRHSGRERPEYAIRDVELSLVTSASFRSRLTGFANIDHNVMHNRKITGASLERLNVAVLFEVGRHGEMLIRDRAFGRNCELDWHLKNHIGLADLPAACELRCLRQILWITLLRAAIHPSDNRIDFFLRQSSIVFPTAVLRIGVPGRHLLRGHLLPNRFRPRPGLLVAHQRHWRDLAGPVTAHTVLVENWRDVF